MCLRSLSHGSWWVAVLWCACASGLAQEAVPGEALDAELRRREQARSRPGQGPEAGGDAAEIQGPAAPQPDWMRPVEWVGPRPGELPPPEPQPPGPEATVRERQKYWATAPMPSVQVPPGLERRRPLSEAQRRQKRFQKPFNVIGVPTLGGNPDVGVIVGAVSAVTWYGDPERDPYYDYAPFKRQLIVEAQVALKRKPNVLGRQHYMLRYTAPYLANTLVSLVTEAGFLMDANAQYFGTDASSMGRLDQIGPSSFQGERFDSFRDYQSALREVQADGTTYASFNNYLYQEPQLLATARIDLLGGILIPAASLKVSHVFIDRYGGDTVRGEGGRGLSPPTKLDEDCDAGTARFCSGTWDNTLKGSVTLDMRDLPVDPDQGVLVDVSFEGGPRVLGSPGYWRSTNTLAAYWSPLETLFDLRGKWSQLVLAGRLLYSVQGGRTPFYARNRLAFSDRTVAGLGGIATLRGYRLNRFVGDVMAMANLELRYDLLFIRTNRSTINFKLVPFFDTGRVWDQVSDTNLRGYRHNGGLGVYLQWNQSNIIRADVGVGDEGVSGGVSFGLLF